MYVLLVSVVFCALVKFLVPVWSSLFPQLLSLSVSLHLSISPPFAVHQSEPSLEQPADPGCVFLPLGGAAGLPAGQPGDTGFLGPGRLLASGPAAVLFEGPAAQAGLRTESPGAPTDQPADDSESLQTPAPMRTRYSHQNGFIRFIP